MGKDRSKNRSGAKKKQTTAAVTANVDDTDNAMPNGCINARDENDKDLFDKMDKVMKNRKEHINNFYHNTRRAKGYFSIIKKLPNIDREIWLMKFFCF
jgi:hypothetical protein